MSRVRVGLVGAGRWAAQHHIPGLLAHPDAELVAIAEPDTERRRLVAERFEVPYAVGDYRDLLDGAACEALVVASPPAAHHEAAAAALDRGLHVLVEKPMAVEAADAWDLVDRADAADRTFMVGYTFELTSTAAEVRRIVADGELGEMVLIDGIYASAMRHLFDGTWPFEGDDALARPKAETFNDPVVSGGGQSHGQLTHLVGSILGATGLEPQAVNARLRPKGDKVDLHDALLVDFGEAVATVASTCVLPAGHPPMWEVRYVGTHGTLVHDLASGAATVRLASGTQRDLGPLPDDERYPSGAVAVRFVDVVLGRAENPAPGDLGAWATAIIEAAAASARDGGASHPVLKP